MSFRIEMLLVLVVGFLFGSRVLLQLLWPLSLFLVFRTIWIINVSHISTFIMVFNGSISDCRCLEGVYSHNDAVYKISEIYLLGELKKSSVKVWKLASGI